MFLLPRSVCLSAKITKSHNTFHTKIVLEVLGVGLETLDEILTAIWTESGSGLPA